MIISARSLQKARARALVGYPRLALPRWASTASDGSSGSSGMELEVTDPLELYRGMVLKRQIKPELEQIRALVQIRKLHEQLLDYNPPIRLLTLLESLRPSHDPLAGSVPSWPFKRSPLSSIGTALTLEEEAERDALVQMGERERSQALVRVLKESEGLEDLDTPRGFLLTGPPGTGKSLLMDIWFKSLPTPHKKRVHYHYFLLYIYGKVHEALERQRLINEAEERAMNDAAGEDGYPWSRREEMKALAITNGWQAVFAGGRSPNDPDLNTREFVLASVARELIKTHGWLLAFDEIQLVDIAGAGLINRVLSWYWRLGGVVVGTSNRVPEDLYNSGVQKASVHSFLVALASRSPVVELNSAMDWRREAQRGQALDPADDREPGEFGTVEAWQRWGTRAKGWFVKGEEADFAEAVKRVVGDEVPVRKSVKVYGREVKAPWVVGGVAKFSFAELCEAPLGPADFTTLAATFHTIILTDIPVLKLSAKNEARRLITLLDSLYESKTRLLALAETTIDDLFFPDAIGGPPPNSTRTQQFESSPDDVSTRSSSALRAHAGERYGGVDAAGEITDSLTEEMLGDVAMDLEAPYRPNVSAYDATQAIETYNSARADLDSPSFTRSAPVHSKDRPDPHPSASTPSFASLAIFTGEEERFAFKRAVSRVHELGSAEFLVTAVHSPLARELRTWERPANTCAAAASADKLRAEAKKGPVGAIGEKVDLEDEAPVSGVLLPEEMRLKWPQGLPPTEKEVEVKRGAKGQSKDGKPVISSVHSWGVVDSWGKRAGKWGQGAKAYEEPGEGENK